ncbi:MAG TPA: glycosyltransferase, partial [Thermoanaerobaculia bacterium]|nr:glycosyltransferase [Thermoanaerobaculia bacterium]
PTYRRNAGGRLRRALTSVLSQSFADLELIVVDDGSTDGSRELVLALQEADPRIVHVRHELNCGLPALRVNEGIELARGRFVAFQFDDDEWLDGALEALVERARGAPEPAVVYGSALLSKDGWSRELPDAPVHLLTLSFENRIANNSVLVPRALFDRHGMLDPHVAMRRLCDWDLWLRLARHVPFLGVERRVSVVAVASDEVSLGATVPFELPLFRFLQAIPRDHLLTPERWRGYEVDAVRVGEVEVRGSYRERLERDYAAPFRKRLRHAFPHLAPPPPAALAEDTAPRHILFTMDSFYGSFEMCMGQYDLPSYRRGFAKMAYQPLLQMAPGWERDAGLLLLVRTVTAPGSRVLAEARAAGLPVGYYLDDDLLHLHEYGPPFDVLAPGQERRGHLEAQLAGADAVWATNPSIAGSVRRHNRRIVPHNGAVPESWLPADLRPRGAGGPIRVGYAGDPYRIEEFSRIWSALVRISEELGDRLVFDLWGLDAGKLPPLASPVSQRPYTYSYPQFIDGLREARFDILLTPLLTAPRPRLAKAPSQYYHTAVAGALGIFSDVPPYAPLLHGLTCLKAANDAESWYAALREALTMPAERFDAMRRAMVEHVRLEYTERAQIHLHEAAARATEFHAATRALRGEEGRPRVRHRIPGAAELAREYGVEVVEGADGEAALTLEAPPPVWIPGEVFERGLRRVLGAMAGESTGENTGELWIDTSGAEETPAGLWEALAGGRVVVSNSPGAREPLEDGVTAVLFEGDSEAAVAAAVARARAEYPRLLKNGWRLARGEVHPQRAASELFALYSHALRQEPAPEPVRAMPEPPPAAPPSRRERLRGAAKTLGIYRPLSRLYWAGRRKRVLVTYESYITSVYLYWDQARPALEAATGRSWLLLPAAEVPLEDLYTFHAVIVARGISKRSLEILRTARRYGCRTVYDTDDNLLLIDQAFSDPENPWRRIFGEARPEIEAMLREADMVKLYGEPAVPSFLPYNRRIAVIRPYQILDGEEPPPPERRPVTVGFLGSYFKDDEFKPVVEAIQRILQEGHPIRFEFFGFLPKVLEERAGISHVPWRSSYPEYRRTLAGLGWEIGLAPLRDLEFNRGKNNAKYREYAAAGIAGIYSDAEVYRTTVIHRETGLVVPHASARAWYEAILELAGDADLRESIRRNAFADLRANYRREDYVARVAALLEGPLPPPRPAGRG